MSKLTSSGFEGAAVAPEILGKLKLSSDDTAGFLINNKSIPDLIKLNGNSDIAGWADKQLSSGFYNAAGKEIPIVEKSSVIVPKVNNSRGTFPFFADLYLTESTLLYYLKSSVNGGIYYLKGNSWTYLTYKSKLLILICRRRTRRFQWR